MNPDKIKWYLGSSSLSILMEQDRKHWLLKTDQTKQVQDSNTGDQFRGQINNLGSDVIIEAEKLYSVDYVAKNGTFSPENVSDILEIAASTFPYVPKLNGLYFARLKSINLDIDGNYHNFQMMLLNTRVIFVPMAPDPESDTVLVYRWLRTPSKPILRVDDGNGGVIDTPISFAKGVNSPVFYYPLEPVLIPFDLIDTIPETPYQAVTHITTTLITDESAIGKPLFWFTCDESDVGPRLDLTNAKSAVTTVDSMYLEVGCQGDESQYKQHLYPATGAGGSGFAPDGELELWKIRCAPKSATFTNDASDFNKEITDITFHKENATIGANDRIVNIRNVSGNNIITMSDNELWQYVDEYTYETSLSDFLNNMYINHQPLISAFDVAMDQSIPFMNTTTDIGYSGIQIGSSKNTSEQLSRYPHDITNMNGLPEWLNSPNATPQHMSLYALHNTPYYDPTDQNTRQIAGLILDPGVERSYDSRFYPGQYRILSVDIVKKGSGYNAPGKSLYSDGNFVFVMLNSEKQAYAFFEITEVDENGGVLAVRPVYRDMGDAVKQFFRGFYNPDVNAFYYTPSFTGEPIPVYNGMYYVDQKYRKVYQCNLSGDEPVYELTHYPADIDPPSPTSASLGGMGVALEQAYDPITLTGNYMHTVWDTCQYTEDEIREVREAYERGQGDGLMPSGTEFWWYTATSGEGLVLGIRLQYLEEVAPPITSDSIPTEEIGRVYVLSNDSPIYINNKTASQPKPDRTIARICDIPTSVMQLSNISGLAPTSVVDKKYIRSEASFTEEDQDYIYNGSKNRWVRPIHYNANGHRIIDEPGQTNNFIFDSFALLESVSMTSRVNDFMKTIRLNRFVSPNDVSIDSIYDPGSGYSKGSMGVIVVGGYSFTYIVDAVNSLGGVMEASLGSNDDPDAKINLANFDMDPYSSSGLTTHYGTSPIGDTSGTGLRVRFMINNYKDLVPQTCGFFEDMYAFARDVKGVWLCTFNATTAQWERVELVAQSNYSEQLITKGTVSLKDSYINSILPHIEQFTVSQFDRYTSDTLLRAYQTASSINVIDETHTPVWIPSASNTSELIDDRTVVDINKIYCNKFGQATANSRNVASVIQALKNMNLCRYDSYIFWKWNNTTSTGDVPFTYGIIHRSLDNLQSTDQISSLPDNDLLYKNFVNTNPQTTIMWNVAHLGPMVWMFNPSSTIHEKYYVDADTRELYVTRTKFSWANVEVMNSTGTERISLLDSQGKMAYNIITNNRELSAPSTSSVIYQQPDYTTILEIGDDPEKQPPVGAWELVFPSNTHSFVLRNVSSGNEFTPVKMNVIRGSDIPNDTDVLNAEGIPVNYKTLLMDENTQTGRMSLRVYDRTTGEWINV